MSILQFILKLGEYAPGLPKKGIKSTLPTVKSLQQWDFVVQKHDAVKRGTHYDIRLAPPGGPGFSWAVDKLPSTNDSTNAIRTEDHTVEYFDFKGKIKKGYGKGKVTPIYRGKVDVIESKPNKITFYWYGPTGTQLQKYTLINLYGTDVWRFVNHTFPKDIKKYTSTIKPLKYKEMPSTKYIPQQTDFITPKIDGASSLVILKGGKLPTVFSKRTSKKTKEKIEYTPKIEKLLTTRVPKELKTTILRAEVFAATPEGKELPNRLLGGILNSSVYKSREMQKRLQAPLRIAGFDVVKYKGKDVSKLPIHEKYKIIDEISKIYPVIDNPLKISNGIKFKEGMVVWRNNTPIKVKQKMDYDVYVRKIFPNIHGNRAGGFEYSYTKYGPIVGRVGTGFTHKELEDMLKNPHKYIGRVAKVSAQEKHPSGALRAPSFIYWHLDK